MVFAKEDSHPLISSHVFLSQGDQELKKTVLGEEETNQEIKSATDVLMAVSYTHLTLPTNREV